MSRNTTYSSLLYYFKILESNPVLKEDVTDEISELLASDTAPKIRIDSRSGCWFFIGGTVRRGGYTYFKFMGSNCLLRVAPVLMYVFNNIQPPDSDKEYSHLCGRSACVKPGHICLESHSQNERRKRCHRRRKCLCDNPVQCVFGH